MLYNIVLVFHILICFFLICIVLLQSGKGAEMGAAFGGSSQTLFGSRGAATFINKLTTGAAVFFMITSLFLSITLSKGSSIIKNVPVEQGQTAPQQIPAQPLSQPAAK
jgi:preprotein translocase subunit SecG